MASIDAMTAGGNVEGNLKGSLDPNYCRHEEHSSRLLQVVIITGLTVTIVDMKNTAVDFTGSTITGRNSKSRRS